MSSVAVLHNIRSIHNVGSIFRTAAAAGARKIYLCGITPSPLDRFGKIRPQFAKVSLGGEKYVSWEKIAKTEPLIDDLKENGWIIFAVEQARNSIPYYKAAKFMTHNSKFCLVVGHETRGLPNAILKKADKILEIPIKGVMVRQAHHPKRSGFGKESLNVAVAFGIALFRLTENG